MIKAGKVTIDLAARITGYQESLAKLNKAMQQVNPGAKIYKSIQAAFKNAEGAVQKLAKTPIVDIKSDQQLQNLVKTLQNIGQLIDNVDSKIQSVTFSDLKTDVLNQGLEEVNKELAKLNQQLNNAKSGDVALSKIAQTATTLKDTFKSIGLDIKDLGANQGIEKLNEALKKSEERAEKAKKALQQAEAAIANWSAQADNDNLFSSAQGGKGARLQRELTTTVNPIVNIDFSKNGGFSPQAIQTLRDRLNQTITQQLTNKGILNDDVASQVSQSLDRAFNSGLNSSNIATRITDFANEIRQALDKPKSEINEVYRLLFGEGATKNTSGDIVSNTLKQLTLNANIHAQRLKKYIKDFTDNGKLTNNESKTLFKLVDENELERVRQRLLEVLRLQKQAHAQAKQLPKELTDKRDTARKNLANQTKLQSRLNRANDLIINSKAYKDAQAQIATLEKKVKELQAALSKLQGQKVDVVHQLGTDASEGAHQMGLATQQTKKYQAQLDKIEAKEKLVGKIEGVVQRWFSIYAAVRMVSNAIKQMISTIQQLDKTITNIAIVTNMSQEDLWGQMGSYTEIARDYAASISGVYEVSQLYYQQGLQTADVLTLTQQTLKMARVSGLDYADATDYMTNALRSFKMEMSEASSVVDTYSAIAAASATSVKELAEAMSKTASSAEAVGSSLGNTTAMMAVMIQATRQSAQNIGSAMKSIISRYGQLKENPVKLVDSEGEALSLNKVDKALQSVGISIHNAQGQFRDFDDVIMELSASWDTIDINTQRYIATIMAGNRQQSRFLALVSSYDRLKELSETAADSENASQLQYLKTLDSIEAKTQQLQTSIQSLYTGAGFEELYKSILDFANNIVKSLANLDTIAKKPVAAVIAIGSAFYNLANIVTTVFQVLKAKFTTQASLIRGILNGTAQQAVQATNNSVNGRIQGQRRYLQEFKKIQEEIRKQILITKGIQDNAGGTKYRGRAGVKALGQLMNTDTGKAVSSVALSGVSLLLSTIGSQTKDRTAQGLFNVGSSAASGAAMLSGFGLKGMAVGALLGAVTGFVSNASNIFQSAEEKLKTLQQQAKEANNEALKKQAEVKDLGNQIEQLRKLQAARYDSAEAEEAYYTAANQLADTYPDLITQLDAVGNATVNLEGAQQKLADIRKEGIKAAQDAAVKEYKAQKEASDQAAASKNTYIRQNDNQTNLYEWQTNAYPDGNWMDAANIPGSNVNKFVSGNSFLYQLYSRAIQSGVGIVNALSYDYEIGNETKQGQDFLNNINVEELTNPIQKSFYEYIQNILNNVSDTIQNSLQEQAKTDATRRAGFARTIGASNLYMDDMYSYLDQMTGANSLLLQIAEQEYTKFLNGKTSTAETYKEFLEDKLPGLITTTNDALQHFWNSLETDDARAQFNTLSKQANTMTRDQMEVMLSGYEQLGLDIENYLTSLYGSAKEWEEKIAKRAQARKQRQKTITVSHVIDDESSWEQDIVISLDFVQNAHQQLYQTLGDRQYINLLNFYDNLQKQVDNRQISKERGQNILNQYLTLAEQLSNFDPIQREAAESIFYNWTDWTITGIKQLAKQIKQATGQQIDVDKLRGLVVVNLTTLYGNIEQQIISSIKQYDQAISDATKGLSNDKAMEFAQKMGITLKDMRFQDGKWYYDNFEQIQEKLLGNYKAELKSIEDSLPILRSMDLHISKQTTDEEIDEWDDITQQNRDVIKQYRDALKNLKQGETLSFEQYLNQRLANIKALTQAEKYALATSYLSIGNTEDFTNIIKEQLGWQNGSLSWDDIKQWYLNGELPEALEQYRSAIKSYLQQGSTAIYDATAKILNGQALNASIVVNKNNRDLLKQITGNDPGKDGTQVLITAAQIASNWQEIIKNIQNDSLLTIQQQQKQITAIWNAAHKQPTYDAVKSALDSYEAFDISVWFNLPEEFKKIATINHQTGKFSLDLSKVTDQMLASLEDNGASLKQINALRASIEKNKKKEAASTIIADIVKNRNQLSEDNIASLATLLNQQYDKVIEYLNAQENGDGTYSVNLGKIQQIIQEQHLELNNTIQQLVADQMQNIVSSITSLATNQSKGYTNLSDMQKIVNSIRDFGITTLTSSDENLDVDINTLFEWNKTVNAFVLSSEGLFAAIMVAKAQLQSMDENTRKQAQQLLSDIERQVKSNINLSGFLSASNNKPGSKAYKELEKGLNDYNNYLIAIGETTLLSTQDILDNLQKGGNAALQTAKQLAKELDIQLSSEDYSKLYRKNAEKWLKAESELQASVGSIVSNETAEILEIAGGETKRLNDTSSLVIKSADHLVSAYGSLYYRLRQSGEATLAQLNNIKAKQFQAIKGGNLLSSLANAAEMTWTNFAEMLTSQGIELTSKLRKQLIGNNLISQLGGGKIRLNSFTKFAEAFNIDQNTEEYKQALKAYNDAFIKIGQQRSSDIQSQLNSILNASQGSQLNITTLFSEANDQLVEFLNKYYKDAVSFDGQGILTINTSNQETLRNLTKDIANYAIASGLMTAQDALNLQLALQKNYRENKPQTIISNIISNREKLTQENIAAIAKMLNISYEKALQYVSGENEDGTYRMNIAKIKQLAKDANTEIRNELLQSIEQQIDNIVSNITGISSNHSQGYTSLEKMVNFRNRINNSFTKLSVNSNEWSIDDLFEWDETLHAYVLTNAGIIMQLREARLKLKQSNLSEEERLVTQQLIDDTISQTAEKIDVSSFLSADRRDENSQAYKQLQKAINDYNSVLQEAGSTTEKISIKNLVQLLEAGGAEAVAALQQIARIQNRDLSDEQIRSVFTKKVDKLIEAQDQLFTSAGGVVSEAAANIINESGGEARRIGSSGNYYVIKSATNLVKAYQELYNQLIASGEATREQLQEVLVKMHEAQFTSINAISNIQNGIITYASIMQMLNNAGLQFDDTTKQKLIDNNLIKQLDNGDFFITDFESFADTLGVDKTSTVYKEAYTTWINALMERNTKTVNSIYSELNAIISAHEGDSLNISTLWQELTGEQRDQLFSSIEATGVATIENGVLYLKQGAEQKINDLAAIFYGIADNVFNNNPWFREQLVASADKAARESGANALLKTVFENRQSLNEDNILAIAKMLNAPYNKVKEDNFKFDKKTGQYSISIGKLTDLAKKLGAEVNELINDLILNQVSDAINALSGLSSKTFNANERNTFKEDLSKKMSLENRGELFRFDQQLNAYVLSVEGIYLSFRQAAHEIESIQDEKAKDKAIVDLVGVAKSYLQDLDVMSLVTSDPNQFKQATQNIKGTIDNYNAAVQALRDAGITWGKVNDLLDADALIQAIKKGGSNAVAAAQKIAHLQGKTLSEADIQTLYRKQADRLLAAAEELTKGVGAVISSSAADLLTEAGIAVARLTKDGAGVIKSAQDLVEAYNLLYIKLKESGTATLSQLNKTMAQKLGAEFDKTHGSSKSVEWASKAASMSYEDFGEMLAQAGYELTEATFAEFKKGLITELGGGNIRINDFYALAKAIGWDTTSDAFISALKTFNDSIVQLVNQTERTIADEIQSIEEAKPGDKVNLTTTYKNIIKTVYNGLQEAIGAHELNTQLFAYGAEITNSGILNLSETANIPAILQVLRDTAKKGGLLLEADVAELTDTIDQLLNNFADILAKGIEGSLSKSQARELQVQAKNWFGIDLDFTQTYEGLKLSTDQATKLYTELKKVGGESSQIAFNALKDALSKHGQAAENSVRLTNEIVQLTKQIAENEKKGTDAAKAQNQVLQERLGLYNDIRLSQLDDADSYKWMDQALPSGLQGGLNAWQSFVKAAQAMNQAANTATKDWKEGDTIIPPSIPFQDFVNMANMFDEMAGVLGNSITLFGQQLNGDMTGAAALIEKGASALKYIDGKGIEVSLEGFALDFTNGAASMSDGIDDGMKAFAQSQIKMLDGLIQFLETIVAMEEIGKLDVEGNGIDMGDLFKGWEDGTAQILPQTKTAAKNILAAAENNEDLKNGLNTIKVNGQSINQILNTLITQERIATKDAEVYTEVLAALVQMMESGQYDQEALAKSIQQIAKATGATYEIDLGNGTSLIITQGYQFTKKDGHYYGPNGKDYGTDLNVALQQYNAEVAQQTFETLDKKGSINGEVEFTIGDQTFIVKQNTVLVKDSNGLIWVDGQPYTDEQAAFNALNEVSAEKIRSSSWALKNASYVVKNNKPIEVIMAGHAITVCYQGNSIVGYKNAGSDQIFPTQEEAYSAYILEQQFGGSQNITVSAGEKGDGKVTGILHYGVGVEVTLDADGNYTYSVNGEKCDTLNEAKNKSAKLAKEKIEKAWNQTSTLSGKNRISTFTQYLLNNNVILKSDKANDNGDFTYTLPNGKQVVGEKALQDWVSQNLIKNGQIVTDTQLDAIINANVNSPKVNITFPPGAALGNKMTKEIHDKLVAALGSGDRGQINEVVETQFGVKVEWTGDATGSATMQEIQEIAKLFGLDLESKDLTLTPILAENDDTAVVKALLDGETITKKVNVEVTMIGQAQQAKQLLNNTDNNSTTTVGRLDDNNNPVATKKRYRGENITNNQNESEATPSTPVYVPHPDHTLGSGQRDALAGQYQQQAEEEAAKLRRQQRIADLRKKRQEYDAERNARATQVNDYITQYLQSTEGLNTEQLEPYNQALKQAGQNYITNGKNLEAVVDAINDYNEAIRQNRQRINAEKEAKEKEAKERAKAAADLDVAQRAARQADDANALKQLRERLNAEVSAKAISTDEDLGLTYEQNERLWNELKPALEQAQDDYVQGKITLQQLNQAIEDYNTQIEDFQKYNAAKAAAEKAQRDGEARTNQLRQRQAKQMEQQRTKRERQAQDRIDSLRNVDENASNLNSELQLFEQAIFQAKENYIDGTGSMEQLIQAINDWNDAIEQKPQPLVPKQQSNNPTNTSPTVSSEQLMAQREAQKAGGDLQYAQELKSTIESSIEELTNATEAQKLTLTDKLNEIYNNGQNVNAQMVQALNNLLAQIQQRDIPDTTTSETDSLNTQGLEQLSDAADDASTAAAQAAQNTIALAEAGKQISEQPAQLINGLTNAEQSAGNTASQSASAITGAAGRAANGINKVNGALDQLSNKNISVTMTLTAKDADGQPVNISSLSIAGSAAAKGGIVGGKTLMGELGPQVVVANGRYFVVGQSGAQMVNLPKDAIVFNHLQTERLLKNNKVSGRGVPVTNEKQAVSFAKGSGPAASSASAALATLKQIRAMWTAMLNASFRDLGGLAGREAGSSGGGGGGGGNQEQLKNVTAEIERWYNLLRQIARLEQDITYQNTLQNKLISDRTANGQALYKSYKQQLQYLDQQIIKNQQLAQLQKSWYERKRQDLIQSDYGKIFTYNAEGQLQYTPGQNRGLDILEKLNQRDIYGKSTGAAATAKSQIEYLRSIGFNTENLKYNDDGTIIDASDEKYKDNQDQIYEDMMNNFWDNLDGWRDELDGIYDQYRDQLNNVLENENKRNEILQKIVDNQLSVQQDILKAIESREQKLIDELQNERDALQKSTKEYVDGLSDQLKQERQLYQNQENEKELTKLRRQMAILQRSGGSGSQIRSLQDQIAAKQQDMYFSAQEQQIAAIQKASDLQIQRLDSQIDLMTETLKYQKQNGLLWDEVYQIMASTPEQIRQFITQNTPDFQSASALDVAQKIRDIDLRINEWIGYRDDETAPSVSGNNYYDWDSYSAARSEIFGSDWGQELTQQARAAFDEELARTGDINLAGAAADAVLSAVLPMLAPIDDTTPGDSGGGGSSTGTGVGTLPSSVGGLTRPAGMSDADWQAILSALGLGSFLLGGSGTEAGGRTAGGPSLSQLRAMQRAAQQAAARVGPGDSAAQTSLMNNMNEIQKMLDNPDNAPYFDDLKRDFNNDYDQLNDVNKKKYTPYKFLSGGLIDYTGPAWVDGSPSKPEGILNAQQTSTLRNFMTKGVDTLTSILSQIQQNMHNSSYTLDTLNQEENVGFSIQHLDVNVNVAQIANDYDAKQLGNTVMDEILKIARKSGTRGLNRR